MNRKASISSQSLPMQLVLSLLFWLGINLSLYGQQSNLKTAIAADSAARAYDYHIAVGDELYISIPDSARFHYAEAVKWAKLLKQPNLIADALYYKAYQESILHQNSAIFKTTEELLSIANANGLVIMEGNAFALLADYYNQIGEFDASIEYDLQAINLYKAAKDTVGTYSSYANMASKLMRRNRIDEAKQEIKPIIEYFLSKLEGELSTDRSYTSTEYDVLNQLARTAMIEGEVYLKDYHINQELSVLDTAMQRFKLALKAENLNREYQANRAHILIGIAEVFYEKAQIDSAWAYMNRAESTINYDQLQANFLDILQKKADFLVKEERWTEALALFEFIVTKTQELNYAIKPQIAEIIQQWSASLEQVGRYEQALNVAKTAQAYQDSLNSEQQIFREAQMITQFRLEDQRYDYEIAQLQAQNRLWLSATILLLLVIFVSILGYAIISIRKKNRQLESDQKNIRALKAKLQDDASVGLEQSIYSLNQLLDFVSHHKVSVRNQLNKLSFVTSDLQLNLPLLHQKQVIDQIDKNADVLDELLRKADVCLRSEESHKT